MSDINVKIQKVRCKAVVPEYKTEEAAGMDLHACVGDKIVLRCGEIAMIPTGIAVEVPKGVEAQIRPRSGMSLTGLTIPNSPGTIDSDYRGEIKIIIKNSNRLDDIVIMPEDRIAQLVFCPVLTATLEQVDYLEETERGSKGFGSTGK